jgi:RNA polymerase sigma-70 factor (ECF subfamily)
MDSLPKANLQNCPADDIEDVQQQLRLFVKQTSGRALVMMEAATGHADVARDLVQESFIALYQSYAKRPTTEWTPLFYTILNHRLMDWHRQEARKQKRFGWLKLVPSETEDVDDFIDQIEDTQHVDPAEFLSRAHTLEEIRQAIAKLPMRQQQAFMLRAWENMDTKTTAEIMQCSEGSVKTHYHRAILTLRSLLSQFDNESE